MSSVPPRLGPLHLGHRETAVALAWGVLGAWLTISFELAWVSVRHRAELTGFWELQSGLWALGPAWLLLATPAGLWGAALGLCWRTSRTRGGRLGSVVLLAAFGCAIAWGVGGGRHLASWSARAAFALGVGGAVGLASHWFFSVGARLWALRRPVVLGLALALALACSVLDRLLLVRLYPAFHGGLGFLEFGLVGLGFSRWFAERPSRWAPYVALGLCVAAGLALPISSRSARGFDNFRWLVSEASPSLAWGVELSSLVAPPEPIDSDVVSRPLGTRRQGGGLDFRGRSILLVTIDALRADHVGAYGATRGTTPHIDALARRGVLFEAAYAATPHTSYSLSSLMTGKYMRPLLLQGAGADSDLWPELLRTYGYRTAAFYPPAVFFIDSDRFASFRDRQFGFEYAKVEFAEGEKRIAQIQQYLAATPTDKPLFLWLHLFGPHEPYEQHSRDFGPRDVDRYDSEISEADETTGRVLALFQERDPDAVVIVSADHGEEFGDHGGRYHGTSVYDEQVRVPLVIAGPGLTSGQRVGVPVQTIDLLPTVLGALRVPIPPRIRGRDWAPLLGKSPAIESGGALGRSGRALAETEDYVLLAEGNLRLICARRSGACQLFDTARDPEQKRDVSLERADAFSELRTASRALAASHGAYETAGLRSEGKGWPGAILRGLSGDAEVAPELGQLLDDADVDIRRKSAELLFRMKGGGETSALRLASTREDDRDTRRFIALGLTRAGQGAPLVREMLHGDSLAFRRLAALTLAEQGDRAGEAELIGWWQDGQDLDFEQARQLLEALGAIKSKKAVGPLLARLGDVRLRPHIARVLALIGSEDARPALVRALSEERYVSVRMPLARALLALGARDELVSPLVHFLGVPDPLEGGLRLALDAGLLESIGGPTKSGLRRLEQLGDSGVQIELAVPYTAHDLGTRLVALVRSKTEQTATLVIGRGRGRRPGSEDELSVRHLPRILSEAALRLPILPGADPVQVAIDVPEPWGARPGQRVVLDVFVDQPGEILALALVPRREELPPPPPEPWEKASTDGP